MNNSRRNLLLLFAGTFAANAVHAKWNGLEYYERIW